SHNSVWLYTDTRVRYLPHLKPRQRLGSAAYLPADMGSRPLWRRVVPHPADERQRTVRVKMILPALTEALSPYFRPIKYSLFPPLGLATLAGYLDESDEVTLQDEHVERLDLNDDPELVVIQVYITSASRAYALAD